MFVQSGFWNCCQSAPVASILMIEGDGRSNRGTAREACLSCASTYVRINRAHAAELHTAAQNTRQDVADIIALLESSPWGNA